MATLTPGMAKTLKESVCKGKSDVLEKGEEVMVLEFLNQVKSEYPDEPVVQKIQVTPELIDDEEVYERQSICTALGFCEQLLIAKNISAGFGGA